ncbi:MAG: hypothetical protein RLZZ165_1231 [Bacteroidota bacterium]
MMGNTTPRNNFEFLRLIFAVFVLFTHSYTLSGKSHYDFVDTSTNFQIGFSFMGVRGFFILNTTGFSSMQGVFQDCCPTFWEAPC